VGTTQNKDLKENKERGSEMCVHTPLVLVVALAVQAKNEFF